MHRQNNKKLLLITKITILVLGTASLLFLFIDGTQRMFFFQDDIISLGAVVKNWPKVIFTPNNEHLNILYWPLLYLEWKLFRINYSGYLIVSFLLHILVLIFIFLIVKRISKSKWLSWLAAGSVIVNRNWNEIIWWTTGQMIILSVLTILFSFWWLLRLEKKKKIKWTDQLVLIISAILPGLSWGVGLAWAPLLFLGMSWKLKKNKLKIKWPEILFSVILILIPYKIWVGNNIDVNFKIYTWLKNPLRIAFFVLVGLGNNVVGRWLMPIETIKGRIIILFLFSVVLIKSKFWKKINLKREVLFSFFAAIWFYFIFAIPRWQFGIGQAMAERYSYLPLIFLVIGIFGCIQVNKLKRIEKISLTLFVFLTILLGVIGFQIKSKEWVTRPQKTRFFFNKLDTIKKGNCIQNTFLPDYIVKVDQWKIDHVWPILNKDFNPLSENKNCRRITN